MKTEGLGTNNQIRGVILEGAKFEKKGNNVPVSREGLLKNVYGKLLHPINSCR